MIPEATTILVPPNWSTKSRKGTPITCRFTGLKLRDDSIPGGASRSFEGQLAAGAGVEAVGEDEGEYHQPGEEGDGGLGGGDDEIGDDEGSAAVLPHM